MFEIAKVIHENIKKMLWCTSVLFIIAVYVFGPLKAKFYQHKHFSKVFCSSFAVLKSGERNATQHFLPVGVSVLSDI